MLVYVVLIRRYGEMQTWRVGGGGFSSAGDWRFGSAVIDGRAALSAITQIGEDCFDADDPDTDIVMSTPLVGEVDQVGAGFIRRVAECYPVDLLIPDQAGQSVRAGD